MARFSKEEWAKVEKALKKIDLSESNFMRKATLYVIHNKIDVS